MGSLEITLIPLLSDNYAYLVHDPTSNCTAIVDPGEAAPVSEVLHQKGYTLDLILITHHHQDHIGGVNQLKVEFGASVIAPLAERGKIREIDQTVQEGDAFQIGSHEVKVIETPGHTLGHIAFWIAGSDALFCGDTLFAMGCGRLFEGTPAQMWDSLSKLRALPGNTRVYCGHEYSESNALFAHALAPEDKPITEQLRHFQQLLAKAQPTIPTTIADERESNPFLRVDDPLFCAAVGAPTNDPLEAFTLIRARKDAF
jgi:hydroxyacylglutathione hydrolase